MAWTKEDQNELERLLGERDRLEILYYTDESAKTPLIQVDEKIKKLVAQRDASARKTPSPGPSPGPPKPLPKTTMLDPAPSPMPLPSPTPPPIIPPPLPAPPGPPPGPGVPGPPPGPGSPSPGSPSPGVPGPGPPPLNFVRVFVVNWPESFGGTGVGGGGAPGAPDKKPTDDKDDPNKTTWGRFLMTMAGADPMMLAMMKQDRLGKMATGLPAMGRQLGSMAGSDNPFDMAGGLLGAVGTAGLMVGGPVGNVVGGIALLGATAARAASGIMNFGNNLLKQNFQFAEFSAAMTNVAVTQEIRDIYHSMRTGSARANSASFLADANENLRRVLEPTRNTLAGVWNTTTGMFVNQLAAMINFDWGQEAPRPGAPREPNRIERWALWAARMAPLLLPFGGGPANQAGANGDEVFGGLMPSFLNPENRPLPQGQQIEPGPWQERWNRPRRFD